MNDDWKDALLILGVIWMWIGHIFTPEHLQDLEAMIQWITTITVAIISVIRLYKTIRKPNQIE